MNQSLPHPPAVFFDKDYIHTLAREETIIYKRAVVKELISLNDNTKKKQFILDLIKRKGYLSRYYITFNGVCATSHRFIFNIYYCVNKYYVKDDRNWTHFDSWRGICFSKIKNGIEILGTKPSIKTADNKFKYEGISIKDLKKACKDNGIKKYSKFSKLELVTALLKI